MPWRRLLTSLLVFSLAACLGCASARGERQVVTIEGRVSVKGNEPHTYIAVTTDSGEVFAVVGELAPLIRSRYQNARIKLTGWVAEAAKGPGAPARFEAKEILGQ